MSEKLDNLIEKLDEINKETKRLLDEAKELAKENMRDIFVDMFNENEWLTEIVWTQYTPYFNDGDTCEFDVYETYINGCYVYSDSIYNECYYSDLDEEEIEKFVKYVQENEMYEQVRNVISNVNNFKNALGDDTLKSIFDDHVKVIITRDGITTESFDHD